MAAEPIPATTNIIPASTSELESNVVVSTQQTTTKVNQITQATQPPPKLINRIVAYVNKRIITDNELKTQIAQARMNLQQRGIKDSESNDLQSKVLDQLILQQIQLDLAARSGIKTTDAEVNDAIANLEKSQNVSDSQMRAKLNQQGISYDNFREQINNQIIMERLKQREVDAKVLVNDDEVNRILNSEIYKNKVDYRLADIVINIPEQATQDIISQKEALANQISQKLQHGAVFEQMVLKYSSGPNSLNGGDLGWKSNTSLPPIILNQLNSLKVGEVTTPVKFPVGFFIFKLNGIKTHGTPQIIRQYHVRHILIKVNELTSDDEAHQKIISIRDQLIKDGNDKQKESKDFISLAKQYSEDTSSIKGGDLGWLNKGDTVPQFEQVMLNTPIGQVSQPLRSPFGWHILEVTETRDSNLANDKEKAEIRQELRDMKAQILYAEWLRNLREMAYVKINDD